MHSPKKTSKICTIIREISKFIYYSVILKLDRSCYIKHLSITVVPTVAMLHIF